jgi:hypothetical protein
MEFDRDKLPASIDMAEKAIHQRLRGLPIAHSKRSRRAIREMAPLKRLQPVAQQSTRLSSCQRTYNARAKLRARRARKKT